MAGQPGRSGGHNRRSVDEHQVAGTYRPDRHLALTPPPSAAPVTVGQRRRALAGLDGEARRIVVALLSEFDNWDEGSVQTLRAYALSCARLAALQMHPPEDTRALHREIRACLALGAALRLDR